MVGRWRTHQPLYSWMSFPSILLFLLNAALAEEEEVGAVGVVGTARVVIEIVVTGGGVMRTLVEVTVMMIG